MCSRWVACLVGFVACARSEPAQTQTRPRFGAVMSEVGRRFELAGRASAANRFDLAAFEVGELHELFEEDLPHAELPKEGATAAIPAMADAFLKTNLPELAAAAKAKDARAFADAFARAATACNGCHHTSGHPFIEIPPVPGKAVPDIDPLP